MDAKSQLALRLETLLAERKRRRESFIARALAALGSLAAVAGTFAAAGSTSPLFISAASAFTLFLTVIGINSWGFHRNLRETRRSLDQLC